MVPAMKPLECPSACHDQRARFVPARVALGVVCSALALWLSACQSVPDPRVYATEYPASLKQGQTLDIQVVRREQRVTMTNTTAINFGPSRLWLNRRFSRPIEEWKIGQTLDFHLSEFVDEFGEKFRPGGFFAAEAPDTIVQAQIETPRDAGASDVKVLGLIVVAPAE